MDNEQMDNGQMDNGLTVDQKTYYLHNGFFDGKSKQVAQLSQRDRTAVWVNYGQKWKTVTGRQYFTDITVKHVYFASIKFSRFK